MKVLIADQSNVSRILIGEALAEAQITHVEHAPNGLEALNAVLTNDFDLALIAWNLPKVLGIDILRHIRTIGMTMPVIMFSEKNHQQRISEAFKAGAQNIVSKPFTSVTVRKILEDTMEKAHLHA